MKIHLPGLIFLLSSATFCVTCDPVPLSTDEQEANKFLQHANEVLNAMIEETRLWHSNREYLEDGNSTDQRMEYRSKLEPLRDLVRDVKKFDTSQFKDEELKYIFEIIRRSADLEILNENWYDHYYGSFGDFADVIDERNIAHFSKKKKKLAYYPHIENIFAYSNNSRELKHYWKELRERGGQTAFPFVWSIILAINNAANETGISPLDFYVKEANMTAMERIMNETQPLYNQLHAFIRNKLNRKFGSSIIKTNAIIPDHLFRQVVAQTWTNASLIQDTFPFDKLPNVNKILEEKHYQATDLYKIADKFYKSLGFNSLPENVWGTQIKMSQKDDSILCKPNLFDTTPSVLLFFCRKMNYRTFLQAHKHMGQIYYATEKVGLPSYYTAAHNLEPAVGEAAILSASTLGHLKTLELLDGFEVTEEVELNRLLRMGFHTLFSFRQQFIHSKLMADYLAEKYQYELLNIEYWKLMDQYLGVGPPMNRLEDNADLPEQFYIDMIENEGKIQLNTKILGYQLYKKLCQISGKYSKGSLHKCDFYGSHAVGDALKKMMKLGSSKPLKNTLETILPENPEMSSDALLDYYGPMKTWLEQQNQEAGVSLGWTPSTKKVKEMYFEDDEENDEQ